ncbi:MAG: hypothetical protein IJ061_00125 [Lachnospiraceae bacterium]|nr:hypothetical protein [Lachnospiraceae bacterium]
MSYTENLEAQMFDLWGFDDEDETTEEVIKFLNQTDSFRSFGDGLKAVIRAKMPQDSQCSEKEFFITSAENRGIYFNRNTVNNWFAGKKPKKGSQSRKHMYLISFALDLDVKETISLFEKVYYEKGFYLRRIDEFVYYYCISRHLSIEHADRILNQITGESDNWKDVTLYTRQIQEELKDLTEEADVIDYINNHPHNFSMNNVTANKILDELLKEIRVTKEEKELYQNDCIDYRNPKISYVMREISLLSYSTGLNDTDSGVVGKYKSITSIETMLDVITRGLTRGSAEEFSGKSIFKDSVFPQEISSRFPTKQSFSKKDSTFEELRKSIILLYSYKKWFDKQYLEIDCDIDDYRDEMNHLLFESGMPPLYAGNPFDWLFLYCTLNDRPLDLFRSVLEQGAIE